MLTLNPILPQDSVGGLNELLLQDLGYGSEEKRERELSAL